MQEQQHASSTLRDIFLRQCCSMPDATAYACVRDDLSLSESCTYAELATEVRSLAGALGAIAQAGERVLLALDNSHGLEPVRLFWACMVAGLIPVPAPAPDGRHSKVAATRLSDLAADAGAHVGVTSDAGVEMLGGSAGVRWLTCADLRAPDIPRIDADARSGADLAYLQYTSGSTSSPRGVALTHACVLAQCAAVRQVAVLPGAPSRGLSWLPWFHDYGLLHGLILPMVEGAPSYLMNPMTFLRRPLRWLEAVERFEITHSGAPDFAYASCVQALARHPDWVARLDTWQVASCGAEPVRAATIQAFCAAFAPHGFRAQSFAPAYGLAEAVLVVTVKSRDTLARVLALDAKALESHRVEVVAGDGVDARPIVGCGEPLPGLDLRIVDPVSRVQRRPGQVGEIWISGPTVAQGYWAMPELTADVFRAALAEPPSDSGEGPLTTYLRTGDLGFMDQGQLFVTGRLKDLIVVHGRNLYPQDVEHTAQAAHASIRANGVMAFGVERSSGEGVTLLIECSGRPDETEVADIIRRAERAVTGTHEVEVCDVAVVRSGSLPRTSSGKPRRSAARLAWLAGDLGASVLGVRAASAGIAPRDALEAQVADIWAAVLGHPQPHVTADFFRQGGNSLLATQLVSRLNATCRTDLPIRTVFEHPTIELLAAEIRARAAETVPAAPAVSPVPVSTGDMTAELSYAQQRMWFLHELAPQSTAYHMPLAVRLQGVVDTTALQRAVDRVVTRHAVLRTTFVASASGVASRVHGGPYISITESDLTGPAVGTALNTQLATLTNRPFDLQNGPLLRLDLLRTGRDEAVLLIVMHHIIGDQWSFAVFAEELAACYREALGHGSAGLPELPFQYADYAAWHRRWFEGPRLDSQREYWVRALAGLEPVTLDADHPRPPRASFRGAALRVPLEGSEISALTGIGADHGASLTMVLLAAFFILLRRHTGATDLCIGMPIANRHHLSSERLIGPFVNTLAIRVDLSGVPDFAAVLRRVREVALQAYAHQDMPFEQLVRELDVARAPGRSPVFDLLFNVVNTPVAPLQFPGLAWSRIDFDRQAVQFDLTVTVDPVHDRAISFEYATELFERASVQRLAQRYGQVLREILRGAPGPVHAWPLCDEGERALLATWGRGPERDGPVQAVQQVLNALESSDPARPALVGRDETWSYAMLCARCHRLAHALRGRGIRRGMRVGLCVSRSPWMVAAQLAILRAGAAYVPLDPAYPVERLRDMAQDANLGFVVSERALLGHLAWPRADALLIDEDAVLIAAQPDDDLAADPDSDARPQDPAYVIYTSGSSGRPKGVVVPHRAVANVLASMALEPGLYAGDRLLAVTSLGFDISVLELLLPLAVGACVVLADRQQTTDGLALARLVDTHGVTVMQATPSTWRLMIDSGWVGSRSLRAWVGGETLPSDLADQLLERCAQVWNLYGPTETTVWSTCWQVARERPDGVAIGRPIANTQVYVLDDAMQPCPIGVPGEICIGGHGVAMGYHDRPELTAERFVPDPSAPEQHIYRTGDRGRWRHDGLLEHLGRLDAQVKIRGHRIEPGEIEAALRAHARVSDAVVVAREDRPGDVRLVAYAVPTESGAPDLVDLRTFLGRSLPDVMVPSHVVLMSALPLLPNGKVDRRGLPTPAPRGSRSAAVAPRTALQRAVWHVWSDVLGTDAFGVHDNFFDLGGHSMLAVSMLHRVRVELQRDCPLPTLYREPTIAGLCASLEAGESDDTLEIVPLQPLGAGPALFCICGVHLYQSLAQALAPDVPVYGIFIPTENRYTRPGSGADGKVAGGAVAPSVEQMAAEYVEAIRRQQPNGPYCLAGFSFGGVLAYEAAQQLQQAGQTVAFLGLLDSRLPARGWSTHLRRGQALAAKLRARGLAEATRAWRARAAAGQRVPAHHARHVEDADSGVADDVDALTAIRDTIYREATRRYAPQPYDGEAILVRALNETMPDALRGWHGLVRKLRVVPAQGEHIGMLEPPLAEGLAEALRPYLRPSVAAQG